MFTIDPHMALPESKISAPAEDTSDDEACVLPADTMLILQQFLQEKALKERSEKAGPESAGCFEENWVRKQYIRKQ